MRTIGSQMGLTDLFKRGRSTLVALGARQFTLAITGHGISARPILPASIAHLADGTLVLGPFDLPAARASGTVRTVCIQAGTPPTRAFIKHAMSETSIVTYSTEERGSTKLVHARTASSRRDWRSFDPMSAP